LTPLPAPVPSLTPGPRVSAASSGKDAPIRRAQATPTDLGAPILPGMAQPQPDLGGQSISLQQALTGALTSNPDLVALRTGNPSAASAEAVEVARRFPVTLNPTVFIDYRPITLIPRGTFGTGSPAGSSSTTGSFYHNGQGYLLVALRQPVEWGHQTTHRYNIAKASHTALQWQIVQAELTALVQTYRFFQTAAYRREKLRVAEQLATFNENLLETLDARLKANPKLAPDLPLARVEARASRQQAKAARQDYVTALTDLRNQIGIPETAAETEPLGEFELPGTIPPMDEQAMVQAALQCRPDLHAAQAQIEAACAAVRLAKGDRIPTTIIGPQYVQDEAGLQYVGLNLVPILPILNSGKPLVAQREAEQRRATVAYQQAQQRAVAQVRSAVAKWNGARSLVNDSSGLTQQLAEDVTNLERFYEANQVDLSRVQQARQRLIQLENAQLDAVWAATQAQADLLLALGVPNLIQSLLQAAEADAGVAPNPDGRQPSTLAPAPAPAAASIPASPPTPSPFAPVIR
jgi:cobalt-zinc-cadmium efflux system outer membrane protein